MQSDASKPSVVAAAATPAIDLRSRTRPYAPAEHGAANSFSVLMMLLADCLFGQRVMCEPVLEQT
ncbi:MAG: hypothetical protein EAZ43_04710 [Betaproteobacteria bacterium]|nr:MAG: hypothetical protein EAZ43_04710 [Betaproteobacteria bacterium]